MKWLLILCIPYIFSAQISERTQLLLDEILKTKPHGIVRNLDFNKNVNQFLKKSKTKEKVYLAYNGSGLIKEISIKYLVRKNHKEIDNLFKYYVKNAESYSYLAGCTFITDYFALNIYVEEYRKQFKQPKISTKNEDNSIEELINSGKMPTKRELKKISDGFPTKLLKRKRKKVAKRLAELDEIFKNSNPSEELQQKFVELYTALKEREKENTSK